MTRRPAVILEAGVIPVASTAVNNPGVGETAAERAAMEPAVVLMDVALDVVKRSVELELAGIRNDVVCDCTAVVYSMCKSGEVAGER